MHGRRLLSALILLLLFLVVITHGGEAGFVLLGMGVAVVGLWELTRLVDPSPGVSRVLALLGGAMLVPATYVGGGEWFGLGVILLLLLQLSQMVAAGGAVEANLRRVALSFLGVVYVAGPLSIAVALRGIPGGARYLLLACSIVWVGDTAAFYTGLGLGRHPLAREISPRKSVEGSVSGLVASMLTSWVVGRALGISQPFLSSLLLGGVVGGAGQMGDLVESFFKRAFQVKDTGHLIPGHGGMLDRIDSLLFAIPVVYLWVRMGWV